MPAGSEGGDLNYPMVGHSDAGTRIRKPTPLTHESLDCVDNGGDDEDERCEGLRDAGRAFGGK